MKQDKLLAELRKQAETAGALRLAVVDQLGGQILDLAALMSGVIGSGGKILIAGNGGSATMASHFATELIVRLTAQRNRQSLPAVSLAADTGVLTAAANDFGFENIFVRQVESLAVKGDLLILMSTSGNSENLIRAAQTARQKNVLTGALLGGDGGRLAPIVERALIIPDTSTPRIQEEHLFLVHQLVELVERDLFA